MFFSVLAEHGTHQTDKDQLILLEYVLDFIWEHCDQLEGLEGTNPLLSALWILEHKYGSVGYRQVHVLFSRHSEDYVL